jgi:hypothetical protein
MAQTIICSTILPSIFSASKTVTGRAGQAQSLWPANLSKNRLACKLVFSFPIFELLF